MKENRYFAVIFMFVLTLVFSTILIGLERLTRDRVKSNERIAFEQAVLKVFPEIQAQSATEIHSLFTRDFVEPKTAGDAYEYKPSGQLAGYALPFEGMGFWSRIRGIVGIASDRKTITGIWFYDQAETPGLGARIVEPVFYGQFAGKSLAAAPRLIRIKPQAEASQQDIQAITGATQTCVRLEKLLNEAIIKWSKTQQEAQTP